MKNLAILYSEYSPTIDAIKYQLKNYDIECYKDENQINEKHELVLLVNYNNPCRFNHLKCHHSLLPAFNCNEPEKEAILKGVKVTGITISHNESIIAQYPVFITSDMRWETLKQELNYLEQTIYPLVAEKIIDNEQFEIKTLLGKSSCCSGGCSGCNH